MDSTRVKFCLKILSRFGKIIRKLQGVKFFGAPCMFPHTQTAFTVSCLIIDTKLQFIRIKNDVV